MEVRMIITLIHASVFVIMSTYLQAAKLRTRARNPASCTGSQIPKIYLASSGSLCCNFSAFLGKTLDSRSITVLISYKGVQMGTNTIH